MKNVARGIGVAALVAGVACGEGAPPPSGASKAKEAVPVGPLAPVVDAGAEAASAEIDVAGRVVNEREGDVIGRPIVVVDKRGKRLEVMTDEGGGFHAMGVVPPYDVAVAPAPSGPVITPVAYLGLRRSDPRLEVFEPEGPVRRPASQSIKIGVKLPPCRATVGACWVSVVSASASGGGATAGSYVEGAVSAVYEIEHAWRAESTQKGETVAIHVLVGSADYAEYAYARVPSVAARPGDTCDVGVVTPSPVETTDRVTLAAQARSLPDGWQWTLASWLDLPGGATFALRYEWSAATSMRLPRLPGATLRAGAWAQHPPVEERPYFHRSSQAWTGSLPLGAADIALDVPMGPDTVRPTIEGVLSRRGLGLAWDPRATGLFSLVLVDVVRGRQAVRAFTSETAVTLTRLEALGLGRLDQGDHVLDLTTTPGADVETFTDPDGEARRARFDRSSPGATTYQRFQFQVTQ